LKLHSGMSRYILLFCSCICFLNGCSTGAEREFGGHPSFGDKDLQTLRYWYGKGHRGAISEATHSALADYRADYPALVLAATNKDQRALATLMSFSPMDGEAGEENDVTLGLLLTGLGDDFFSAVLKSQSRAVRKAVLAGLSIYDEFPDVRARNPKTFSVSLR
jgi:hypothetical protein